MDILIVENRTDLINHPYFILLKIWELDQQLRKLGRMKWFSMYMITVLDRVAHGREEIFVLSKFWKMYNENLSFREDF